MRQFTFLHNKYMQGDSLKENGIFNFSFERITKTNVKTPLIIHDEGSLVHDEHSCKTRLNQVLCVNKRL